LPFQSPDFPRGVAQLGREGGRVAVSLLFLERLEGAAQLSAVAVVFLH